MTYKGKIYFVTANTQSLNRNTLYSQTDVNNMCTSADAQIVGTPENDNEKTAILALLQPIAKKVGSRLFAWAACSSRQCGAYVSRAKKGTGYFRPKNRQKRNAFLALCERGESSINTILGPCAST